MTFTVSSYFIEVLGDEDVDLEMTKSLERFGENLKNHFPKRGLRQKR
jgi:hypothetical protein